MSNSELSIWHKIIVLCICVGLIHRIYTDPTAPSWAKDMFLLYVMIKAYPAKDNKTHTNLE